MVWGIFPGIDKNVSWESHMLGTASGIILAVWFRKEGPQTPVVEWDDEAAEDQNIIEDKSDTSKLL
jgi:hypothetical protein